MKEQHRIAKNDQHIATDDGFMSINGPKNQLMLVDQPLLVVWPNREDMALSLLGNSKNIMDYI